MTTEEEGTLEGQAGGYVFGTGWELEAERLRAGEALWDPGTRARLSALPIGPSSRLLEVGAGRGSIAAWMSDLVTDEGGVIATDIDTRHLGWLSSRPRVEVWNHRIPDDPLPENAFDLVHARMVVQHVNDPRSAVASLVSALRPGGWLVLEDTDTSPLFRTARPHDRLDVVRDAAYVIMREGGHQQKGGLVDLEIMSDCALENVSVEGRVHVVRGGTVEASWYTLWLEHLRERMVERALVTHADIDDVLDALSDGSRQWLSQVMLCVVGQKPAVL